KRGGPSASLAERAMHRVVHSGSCWKFSELWRYDTLRPQVWRAMWNRKKGCKSRDFHPQFPPVVARKSRCYARASPACGEEWYERRGAPDRADCGESMERGFRSAQGSAQRDHVPDVVRGG